MEPARLIAALADPAAYPRTLAVETVEVRQTHISIVFLAGPFAYKIKKPLQLGFLDYSSLELRRHYCEQEVHLNRRLAPTVYLGVVPVAAEADRVRIEGRGTPLEWAVKMVRLPEEVTLRARLDRGEINPEHLEALARRLAAFHAQAEAGPAIAAFGRFEVVAANARENFDQAAPAVGVTLSRTVYDRLRDRTEAVLTDLRPWIEARAARGVPRDGHGDLRLDHIYLLPERPPPNDLLIIDCIEFNQRFRAADPVADIAFPVMDLCRLGRRDLARRFADAYFQAANDPEGPRLLPLYTAYRAAVRGKVEGITLAETEVPPPERAAALERARAHWLLALAELEEPAQRPCLVLIGGLPGTGKTTLAHSLARQAGFAVVRSDLVRKQLAGLDPACRAAAAFESGIYAPDWTRRTYTECLRQAENLLFEGRRVLVEASFRTDASRLPFLEAAARWSVPAVIFLCRADAEIVRQRLEHRRDDASDADWAIYLQTATRWEEPGPQTQPVARTIDTSSTPQASLESALETLRLLGLERPRTAM